MVIGLAVGVALIIVFGIMFEGGRTIPLFKRVSIVTIPHNASFYAEEKSSFVPQEIRVVIGVNNTVRWVNQDIAAALVGADNYTDQDFFNATKDLVYIMPNGTFEYTFTKPGEIGYHGKPWQRATVIVLPSQ